MSDIVAGSVAERSLVKSLSERLIARGLSVNVTPLEVLEWNEIECLINDASCTAQPPIGSADVSGVIGKDIALSSTTRDPDNVWVTYWLSAKRDFSAVVFYDEYPFVKRRRIVVNEIPSYSHGTKMVAKRPAVHIPLRALPALRKKQHANISVKTVMRSSQGYVIDAVTGNGEPRVAIVTHHDRWLTGFRDNSIGVLILLKLAELLTKMRVSARLISFTAEEFGDPAESSFYWAYGSRAYSERSIDSSSLDLAIVVDTVHAEPAGVDYVGVRGLESGLNGVKTFKSEVGIGYTDAVSMVNRGIPTVVLHNLSSIKPVYHTDADTYPGRSAEAVIIKIARAITNLIRGYESKDVDRFYRAYVDQVMAASTSILGSHLVTFSDPIALSKCLTKCYTVLAIEGTYGDLDTEIKLLTYTDVLRGVESGRAYTILSEDVTVDRNSIDHLRKLAKARLEEAMRCSRS